MGMKKFVRISTLLCLLALGAVAAATATPRVTVVTLKKAQPGRCTVDVQVTQYAAPTSGQRAVNTALMRGAQELIADFEGQLRRAGRERDRMWHLLVITQTRYVSERWLSVETVGGLDQGGAHPMPLTATRLFDGRSGKELHLGDLFKPASPYLAELSRRCREKLFLREDVKNDARWGNEGSAPKADNYTVFYLDGKNLVIVFTPYQVAPYSSGRVEVKLPYASLAGIARQDGPLCTP